MLPGRSYVSGEGAVEGFTGHEQDGESGWLYAGARYLDPAIGQWLGVDPLADQYPGRSPYNYVMNNPIRFLDPTGLCPEGVNGGEWFEGDDGSLVYCLASADDVVVEGEDQSDKYVVEERGWWDWFMRDGVQYAGEDWERADRRWYRIYAVDAPQLRGGVFGAGLIGPPGSQVGLLSKLKLLPTTRQVLLRQATNPKVRNAIQQLYRRTAKIGDGGTADVLRYEMQTRQLMSKKGRWEKAQGMRKHLLDLYRNGNLNPTDKRIVLELLIDLQNAMSGL